MGYSQENNAEKSIRLLKKMSPQHILVLRNNNAAKIEIAALMPGDIIILNARDTVPADARLIKVNSFKTDESSLILSSCHDTRHERKLAKIYPGWLSE